MVKIALQPLYSLPCKTHLQIILIARTPSTGAIDKYKFGPKTQKFQLVTCPCCPIIPGVNEFEYYGTKGVRFQNNHYQEGPLIALIISYNDKWGGLMDWFVGPDGIVAKYEYSAKLKEFRLEKDGKVRMCESDNWDGYKVQITEEDLDPYWFRNCALHGPVIFADYRSRPETFRWNPYREQLEWISCNCQNGQWCLLRRPLDKLTSSMTVWSDEKRIRIQVENSKIVKRSRINENYLEGEILKPSMIRNLTGKSEEELRNIRYIDKIWYNFSKIYIPKIGKQYCLFPMSIDDDGTFVVDSNGKVTMRAWKKRFEDKPRRVPEKILELCKKRSLAITPFVPPVKPTGKKGDSPHLTDDQRFELLGLICEYFDAGNLELTEEQRDLMKKGLKDENFNENIKEFLTELISGQDSHLTGAQYGQLRLLQDNFWKDSNVQLTDQQKVLVRTAIRDKAYPEELKPRLEKMLQLNEDTTITAAQYRELREILHEFWDKTTVPLTLQQKDLLRMAIRNGKYPEEFKPHLQEMLELSENIALNEEELEQIKTLTIYYNGQKLTIEQEDLVKRALQDKTIDERNKPVLREMLEDETVDDDWFNLQLYDHHGDLADNDAEEHLEDVNLVLTKILKDMGGIWMPAPKTEPKFDQLKLNWFR